MLRIVKFALLVSLLALIQASPYDDGKYRPKKYNIYDDGKYYRPLNEGKYIPGDEGKYTYIYQQGIYPDDDGDYRYVHQVGPDDNGDYRYIHQTGPNGGFGGNGGNGGNGGKGGFGGNGPNGPGGPGGPKGPGGPGGPGGPSPPSRNSYIGKRTYAKNYPYIHKVIKSLVDKYVSSDNFGDVPESSVNHYKKVYADKEIAVKCRYMMPNNTSEFTTQYPPTINVPDGENFGSYYSFRGTKTLSESVTKKLKLEYEVFVRVVEVNNE